MVNRVLLALVGALALGGGGLLAAAGLGAREHREGGLPSWVPALPSWWPERDGVLLDRDRLDELRDQGWWTAALIVGAAAVLLLALWWFAAQRARSQPRALPLRPAARLRARALARAAAADAEALPGVRDARVRLGRRRGRVYARVVAVLEPDSASGPVLSRLAAGPLAGLGTTAGAHGDITHTVRLRVAGERNRRVR
ncbi:hypothetical protein [Streptomyces phytohabitans]|uniref:hypothetical protein n=1 Tax=Streptomyces phytohabitans TaxID=1150371 RepID=UPI00345BF47D